MNEKTIILKLSLREPKRWVLKENEHLVALSSDSCCIQSKLKQSAVYSPKIWEFSKGCWKPGVSSALLPSLWRHENKSRACSYPARILLILQYYFKLLLSRAAGNAEGLGFFPFCPCEQHISVMHVGSLGNSYRVECKAVRWNVICSVAGLIAEAVGSVPHGRCVRARETQKKQILESLRGGFYVHIELRLHLTLGSLLIWKVS